jgi:hypothetical protein
MTIVLQHQFWGLEAEADAFSVTLSFNNRSQRLRVPYDALTNFADPAAKFGLQFQSGPASAKPATEGATQAEAGPPAETSDRVSAEPSIVLGGQEQDPSAAAKVVTLDAFRHKK